MARTNDVFLNLGISAGEAASGGLKGLAGEVPQGIGGVPWKFLWKYFFHTERENPMRPVSEVKAFFPRMFAADEFMPLSRGTQAMDSSKNADPLGKYNRTVLISAFPMAGPQSSFNIPVQFLLEIHFGSSLIDPPFATMHRNKPSDGRIQRSRYRCRGEVDIRTPTGSSGLFLSFARAAVSSGLR